MHRVVEENLEAYLGGILKSEEKRLVEDHLASCESCHSTVKNMREQSELMRMFRSLEDVEPAPGFYARVMDRIEAQRPLSIWSAFLEPVFATRLAVASLALLLLLGVMVASIERGPVIDEAVNDVPEEVVPFVQDVTPVDFGNDPQQDRGVVLVNLASYPEGAGTY